MSVHYHMGPTTINTFKQSSMGGKNVAYLDTGSKFGFGELSYVLWAKVLSLNYLVSLSVKQE